MSKLAQREFKSSQDFYETRSRDKTEIGTEFDFIFRRFRR